MEDDDSAMIWEKTKLSVASIQHSISGILKPGKTDGCSKNQAASSVTKEARQLVALFPVMSTKSSTLSGCTSSDITAVLENESVWSRFHSLGTEMILTTQGRRMFPCCRFRLNGLDPERMYLLIMDVVPLDGFTHKWNGKTWEPAAVGEPDVLGRVCVHPESPARGRQWMESPVSFYKVKLTNNSMDQEGCLVLHPMHRYQPRLHIVPIDSGSQELILLDSHDVKTFAFPKTEFYAVTSYQNPQITQLKIDCNPFAMAFREDRQSIRLLQDKLRLCSPGGLRSRSAVLGLNRDTSEQRQMSTLKNAVSPCIKDHSIKCSYPESLSMKRDEGIFTKIRNTSRCQNSVVSCKEDVNGRGKEHPIEPALVENVAPLVVELNETVSLEQPPQTTDGPVSSAAATESLKFDSKHVVKSQITYAHGKSPTKSFMTAHVPQPLEKVKLKVAAVSLPRLHFLNSSQVNKQNTQPPFLHRRFQRGRKAKAKCWSTVRCSQAPPPVVAPLDVSLQPDLEDVEGMLFVSFAAKESLNIHIQNMKHVETSLHPQSQTQNQKDKDEIEDVNLSMEERLLMLESTLLLDLKQQKHRQVIHPVLQEVGMKLGLLDPLLGIDLRYLGVCLPLPPPVYGCLDQVHSMSLTSSYDAAGSFVSRTGKTNDPTKIKGWRDKFKTKTVQNTPEGLRNSSAFCSDMLDEYLRNEAQQITDRVAVFSKSSTLPVSYQLPSKSSSYVVTLDSILKNRSASVLPNKTDCNAPNETLPTSSIRGSPGKPVSLFTTEQQKMFEEKRKCATFGHTLQSQPHATSPVKVTSSSGLPSRSVIKRRHGRPPLRRNSSGTIDSQSNGGCHVMTPGKTQAQIMLQGMEEEALFNGKVRTHITYKRATFALNSLLTSQSSVRRTEFSMLHHKEDACPKDFCHLGCICDSLHREIRGPIHCQRVECMFDCSCFKHKVFLIRPPGVTNIRHGRKKALMAFSIADPEKEPRPPPALSVTSLWKRRNAEQDPEPLFVPEPAPCIKIASRLRVYVPRPTPQMRDEDKDPVYLYFESMMTCARVREYNSNPPTQSHSFEGSVSSTSQKFAEAAELPEAMAFVVDPGEPEPTKLLEILSECNWEPHRNSVLSALFSRMSTNHLIEPFCLGIYRVQPLSTTLKRGETCSTVTYTVCISRAEETKVTEDLRPAEKTKTNFSKTNETKSEKVSAELISWSKIGIRKKKQVKMPAKKPSRLLPLLTRAASAGYLKAEKKKLGSSGLGLIQVNGKMYTQAKLLMGQMGALHPANRFAAFVTGRLRPQPQEQPKVASAVPKHFSGKDPVEPNALPKVTSISKITTSSSDVIRPSHAFVAAPTPKTGSKLNPLSDIAKLVECSTSLKQDALIAPLAPMPGKLTVKCPVIPDGSKFLLVPVASPGGAAAPSVERTSCAVLPPGQPVVLQPVPGMPGTNFFCQYNGQMFQLVPITPGPVSSPKSCSHSEGTTPHIIEKAADSGRPNDDTAPVQKPWKVSPATKPSLKSLPSIAPKMPSLSVMTGTNIVNDTPAFNTLPSFPAKMGTVSFRLCPPSGESKWIGSKQVAKPPDPCNGAASTLVLPGGFSLIQLPVGMQPPAPPAIPSDATSASALVAELPQNDDCMEKSISQSGSPNTEQKCQTSESCTSSLNLETEASGLNNGNNVLTSGSVNEDSFMEKNIESLGSNDAATCGNYDWVPEGAERVIKSTDCESELGDLDDWPPSGAERILWIDEDDSASEDENEDLNEQVHKNSNTPAEGRAFAEANDLKPAATTGTINVFSSACGECPLGDEDELSCEKTETSESPHTQIISISPETNDEQTYDKQKCIEISFPSNYQEMIHNEPYINANTSKHANDSAQRPTFDGSSILIKKEINNEPAQTLPISPPDESEHILVRQKGPLVLVKIEPYNEPIQKDMVANPSDISEQGLVPEQSFPVINKIHKNVLSNHLDQIPEGHSGLFVKIEPCNDPTWRDTCSKNSVITAEQESNNDHMATVISNHVCKGLVSEKNSQILNKELHNNPVQTELIISTSPNNTDAVHHFQDGEDDLDVDGDAPCPLLEGQTPAANATLAAYLPNVASRKTDPKVLSLRTVLKSSNGSNEVSREFAKHSDKCTGISRIAEHVHSMEVPEPKEQMNWNKTHFAKPVQELWVDEEADVDLVSSGETDVQLSNSSELGSDEGDSSEEEEDNDSSSDEESSSEYESTSDSGTTEDSADLFSEDDDVDIESFDEYQEKMIIDKMENESQNMSLNRAAQFREQLDHGTDIFNTMKILPARVLAKRLNHTEKERARRGELQHAFVSLKRALNIEEQIKMCKHDILIQARFMIRALEDRRQALKEKKKAMLQRRSAYIRRIAELTAKTEETPLRNLMEPSEREKQCKIQNLPLTSSQINHKRTDSDGNILPPRFGRWRTINYIRKTTKKSSREPAITTEDVVLKFLAQNPTGLPPIHNSKKPSTHPRPSVKFTLPKIVLQSFDKTHAVVKLMSAEHTPLPSSSQVTDYVDPPEQGVEKGNSSRCCEGMQGASLSKDSNKENPSSSLPDSENAVQNNTMSEQGGLGKVKKASESLGNMKKKRSKRDVVIEDALSNPDALGPRQLRNRSLAISAIPTTSTPRKRRRRII
ncbi:MAX gene-associated protein isoform X2 [Electrophorus electricus]|uniref:MAX gene-associated protein isoform X2 n=1 Tax=Electrophorus electricus TaxID=8005 RepID=UPI0015D009FB|nr:MAX gene-associated protein isoform X2 [Electrophorus electricus]